MYQRTIITPILLLDSKIGVTKTYRVHMLWYSVITDQFTQTNLN